MNKTFSTQFLTTILLGLLLVLASFFLVTKVLAQSPEPATQSSTEITYPIKELGSCKDLGSCANYCEDPVHQTTCTDFAKQKGFYQDDPTVYADDKYWTEVQKELSCNSAETCANFCAAAINHEKCASWANSNNVPGGYVDSPDKPEYLEKAKETLGCDSATSCATTCNDPTNAQKCTDFADQVGLLGGTNTEGPAGCQTKETCQAYCSDPNNFGECSTSIGGNFAGPGGCTDPASCRTYCENNPEQCRSYAPGSNGVYVPIECPQGETHGPGGLCTATKDIQAAATCITSSQYWDGASCKENPPVGIAIDVTNAHFEARPEMGNCKTPGECFDYCKENQVNGASTCPGFDINASDPTDNYNPYLYYTPGTEITHQPFPEMGNCNSPSGCYDFCKENPNSCKGFNENAPRPPDVYTPGTYYTPPTDTSYVTPSVTSFYTTPIYYTPPTGSTYTTPQYYTPGMYSTPSYQTPPAGSNYVTPTYYTPGSSYTTPTGDYPTPTYTSPNYYTPPSASRYTTPYYYTPALYTTPFYYTPPSGSNYTTPTYSTPSVYSTPQYYTPYNNRGILYSTPLYFTPPVYTTPNYPTPPEGSKYVTPPYWTPPIYYTTPRYYTPGIYPTPVQYTTPPPYTSPAGCTGCTYYTPSPYNTPSTILYNSPPYYSPSGPGYNNTGSSPSRESQESACRSGGGTCVSWVNGACGCERTGSSPYYTPTYPSPYYVYPSPSGTGVNYYTPNSSYTYPSPTDGYATPGPYNPYSTPSGDGTGTNYPTPTYGTPSYGTPSYNSPAEYPTPSYGTPAEYPTPPVQGAQSERSFWESIWDTLFGN